MQNAGAAGGGVDAVAGSAAGGGAAAVAAAAAATMLKADIRTKLLTHAQQENEVKRCLRAKSRRGVGCGGGGELWRHVGGSREPTSWWAHPRLPHPSILCV